MSEITKEQLPEFEKMKNEGGFKNPDDDSFYNAKTGEYSDGKSSSQMSPEAAFKLRKEGYKPFKEAAKAAVEETRVVGGVEAKAGTGEALAKERSVVELDALKLKLGTNLAALGETFALEGKKFSGDFALDKNFDLSTVRGYFLYNFKAIFSNEKVGAAREMLNANLKAELGQQPLEDKEVADFLSSIYVNAAVKSLNTSFATAYQNYAGFKNSLADGKFYKFGYDFSINKNSVLTFAIKPDPDPTNTFVADYQAYDVAHPKPVELTSSEVKLNERAKAFKTSGVGRFLGAMGIINVGAPVAGETKEQADARENKAYAEALSGSNFIAQFFIYFMGGSAMLADGGASIKDTISGLDPKFQAVVKGIEAKVPKMMAKMAEDPKYRTPADELEAAKTELVDNDIFGKILSKERSMPDKTIKLKDKFNVGETGLTIVLKDGAEMIIPQGTSVMIGGKAERAEAEKPRSFVSTVTVTGELPVGTKFSNKVEFEKPGDKKADTAKADAAKPALDTNEKPAS